MANTIARSDPPTAPPPPPTPNSYKFLLSVGKPIQGIDVCTSSIIIQVDFFLCVPEHVFV